jgi:hypothetical protein
MTKLIGRRACLLLLASILMGAMLGAFNSTKTFAQDLEIFDDGYGDGGGGGATWYCGISSVEVNGKTCTSVGCRAYSSNDPTQVCVFRSSDGKGGCPPLEQCQN